MTAPTGASSLPGAGILFAYELGYANADLIPTSGLSIITKDLNSIWTRLHPHSWDVIAPGGMRPLVIPRSCIVSFYPNHFQSYVDIHSSKVQTFTSPSSPVVTMTSSPS